MKKPLVAVCACAMAFLVAVSVGCGGGEQEKKAREYMRQADAIYRQAAQKASKWETEARSISGITDPAAFAAAVEKSKTLSSQTLNEFDQAGSEYKKIIDMSGVQDYKDYADVRISEIKVLKQVVNTLNDTLGKAVALSNSQDTTALANLYLQTTKQIDPLIERGQTLENEAAKLRPATQP